ncbi:MAG: haloacid dehalogenase [Pseudonocardia sp.]|nr:haloacid dehalogenase [Pseudonocardia sp.]
MAVRTNGRDGTAGAPGGRNGRVRTGTVVASAPELRAPPRRPRVAILDVYDTILRLDALRGRFVDVGRPEHECDLFLARAARDGYARALSGTPGTFATTGLQALRSTTQHVLSDEALHHVMEGFLTLPPHHDAELALARLAGARIPTYALAFGSGADAVAALDRAGLRTYLRGTLSTDDLGVVCPDPRAFRMACDAVHSDRDRTVLISVHPGDVHGALRAGLLGGLALRQEGGLPESLDAPHVSAQRVDDVVEQLLDLPG